MNTPNDIRYIADLLDTKFKLPNGWRFGWDGILGFIPGVGNLITDIFSIYILVRAAMSGCSLSVVSRMGINVLIDNIVDKIPLLGFLFDFIWKANTKNVELMDRYFANPDQVQKQSRRTLIICFIFIFLVFVACVTLTFLVLSWLVTEFVRHLPG
ncbi:MAG: DUF4112 domain-containing protein [Bdellovibrionaceae bacterium]|nr:DUF4112 domain-containing protein [Pseudobdellovibrionaceae bacterium]